MSSFLEKLKKGMADRQACQEETNAGLPDDQNQDATLAAYKSNIPELGQTPAKSGPKAKTPKMITQISQFEEESEKAAANKKNAKSAKSVKKTPKKPMANKKPTQADADSEWLNNEGQLAVDVYQTENDLIVQAAIAGMKVEDLDVLIEDEVITIKGTRPNPLHENGDYFIEECYWGTFSRKIILPVEVDSSRADAAMKEGILTIRIPKIQREKKKKLVVK